MIHDVPKPEISPAFTVDDIHKIREWHYERLKDASINERLADIKRRDAKAQAHIESIRAARKEKAV
ncbi:MAG: hypothetical protein LBS35_05960 [Synergistaceae bacterium]|nr:hypothetical protein [Synergistaceae bacterium]